VTSRAPAFTGQFSIRWFQLRRPLTSSSPREIDFSHYAISFIDELAGAETLGSCLNLKFYLPFKLSNKTPYRRHQLPMRTRHRVPDFLILSQAIVISFISRMYVSDQIYNCRSRTSYLLLSISTSRYVSTSLPTHFDLRLP